MLYSMRNRRDATHCTCCDITPSGVRLERRRVKRRERQEWRREAAAG